MTERDKLRALLYMMASIIGVLVVIAVSYVIAYNSEHPSAQPTASSELPPNPVTFPTTFATPNTTVLVTDPYGYGACQHLDAAMRSPSKTYYIHELWIASVWAQNAHAVEIKSTVVGKDGRFTMPADVSDLRDACEKYDFEISDPVIR